MKIKPEDSKGGHGNAPADGATVENADDSNQVFKRVVIIGNNDELFTCGMQKLIEKCAGVTDNQVLVFGSVNEAIAFTNSTREKVFVILDCGEEGKGRVESFVAEAGNNSCVIACSDNEEDGDSMPEDVSFVLKDSAADIITAAVDLFLNKKGNFDSRQMSLDFGKGYTQGGDDENGEPHRSSSIPPTITDDSGQPEVVGDKNGKLIVIVDDKYKGSKDRERTKEIVDLLREEASGIYLEDVIDVVEFGNRTKALEYMSSHADKITMLISDVYTHTDIDIIDFLNKARESVKFILVYTTKIKQVLDEIPDLDPASDTELSDALVDKHGNFREGVRNALIECFNLQEFTKEPNVEGGSVTLSVPPETLTSNKIHTWLDDVRKDGKLGDIWGLVQGDPNARTQVSGKFLNYVVREQMFDIGGGKKPRVLMLGAGPNAPEVLHLTTSNTFHDQEVEVIEADPKMRSQAIETIENAGVSSKVKLYDCLWQEIPDHIQGKLDCIISQGNEIECLRSPEEQLNVFKVIFDSLNPGGRFAYDIRNKEKFMEVYRGVRKQGVPKITSDAKYSNPGWPLYNGKKVLGIPFAVETFDDQTRVWVSYTRIFPQIKIMDANGAGVEDDAVLTMLLSSLQSHITMLNDIGFEVREIHGDYNLIRKVLRSGESITDASAISLYESGGRKPNFFQIIVQKPAENQANQAA